MGPFWLVAVRGRNFRSFPVLDIQFSRSGLTLARGHNLDTGGSSYSGKSTIGLAVAWALGYLPYSAKDQRRWGSDGPVWVELDVGTEAGIGTIRVGDKPFLKLPDGRKITSSTAIKEELSRFLGVTPDVLAALTWQRQKKGSRFLSKTDAEKKEFLSNVMPFLTKLEQVADTTDVEIKAIQADLEVSERLVAQEESNLRSLVVSEPVLVQAGDTSELMKELWAIDSDLRKRRGIVEILLERAEGASVEVEGFLELEAARNQAISRETNVRSMEGVRIQEFNAEAKRLGMLVNAASYKASSVDRLREEVRVLETAICPTCIQPWVESARLLAETQEALQAAEEAQRALPGLILESQRHKFVPDPLIAKLEAVRANIEKELYLLRAKQTSLLETRANNVAKVKGELAEIDRLDYLNKLGIGKAKHAGELAAKENAHRAADYEAAVARREASAAKLAALRSVAQADLRALHQEQDFQALIGRGGFLGSIFDEVLREISEETNNILRAVANTAHVSVQFLSEAVTQKGKINKVITPAVTISGNSADLESGASGGMETSIGLAVDLAVATVISRRTNTWPGWLILDESFVGLDQVSKETCMEILKAHALHRLVVVVDHAAETKELFSNFIDIEFQNGVSKIL